MARPIPDMDKMTAEELAANDLIIIDDTSAGETKTMEVGNFFGLPKVGWTSILDVVTYSSYSATTRIGVINVPSDATLKYIPGMRYMFTQATGGLKYALIHAVSATTLTLHFPIGTVLNNEAITNPYYSVHKAPFGFPLSPTAWQFSFYLTTTTDITIGSYGTWYTPGNIKIDLGPGSYRITAKGTANQRNTTTQGQFTKVSISSIQNALTNPETIQTVYQRFTSTSAHSFPFSTELRVLIAANTSYWLNINAETGAGTVSVGFMGLITNGYTNMLAVTEYL